jgi:hypothetical protein
LFEPFIFISFHERVGFMQVNNMADDLREVTSVDVILVTIRLHENRTPQDLPSKAWNHVLSLPACIVKGGHKTVSSCNLLSLLALTNFRRSL